MPFHDKHIPRSRIMQWTAVTLVSLLTVDAEGGGTAPPPLPTDNHSRQGALLTTTDEDEDYAILLLLIELMCALLGCEDGDPLLPLAETHAHLNSPAAIESEMGIQMDVFYARGPRPDLTPSERSYGRRDAADARAFIRDRPGIVNESLADAYCNMLSELINAL